MASNWEDAYIYERGVDSGAIRTSLDHRPSYGFRALKQLSLRRDGGLRSRAGLESEPFRITPVRARDSSEP